MNKINISLRILIAIIIISMGSLNLMAYTEKTRVVSVQAQVVSVQAQSWDYMIEVVPDLSFVTVMNELGGAGWELVFARRASNGESGASMVMSYECIFKRSRLARGAHTD